MTRKIAVFLLSSLLLIVVYSMFIFASIKFLQANLLAFVVYFTLMIFMLLIFISLLEIESNMLDEQKKLFISIYS